MTEFTAEEKRKEAEREVKMRNQVYPRWVAAGNLTPELSARRIAIMAAMADDYRKLEEKDRLL